MAQNYDDEIEELQSMIRTGTVIKVKEKTGKVQVKLDEEFDGMITEWLPVLYHHTPWLPNVNDTVLMLYVPNGDGDGYILGRY